MTVESGFFSHHLAVAPDVNRRAVRAGNFAGRHARASQSAAHRRRESFLSVSRFGRTHDFVTNNLGLSPELSYTVH